MVPDQPRHGMDKTKRSCPLDTTHNRAYSRTMSHSYSQSSQLITQWQDNISKLYCFESLMSDMKKNPH